MNNKHNIAVLFSVLITITFVNGCEKDIDNNNRSIIKVPEFDGVIFGPDCNEIMIYDFDIRNNIDGYWFPSEEDIREAEISISSFLKTSQPEVFTRIDKYGRQYFGIIVKGRKRIYCNFFMNPKRFPNRYSEYILVLDGGNRYFRIEYDVDSKMCINCMINL